MPISLAKNRAERLSELLLELRSEDYRRIETAVRELCGDYRSSYLGYENFNPVTSEGILAEICFVKLDEIHKRQSTPIEIRMPLDKYFALCPTHK